MAETKEYKGYWFNADTPDKVCEVVVSLMHTGRRVRLDYGYTDTGISWGETYGITGYISSSTGPKKIPILVHNSRSLGGSAILTHRILSITASAKPHTTFYKLNPTG